MRNFLVVLSTHVSKPEIELFIEALGGKWDPDPTLDQGVMQRGGARIYIDYFHPSDVYSHQDLQALTKTIGHIPTAGINVHIGHSDGSEALAHDFANNLMSRWGGYFDDKMHEIA